MNVFQSGFSFRKAGASFSGLAKRQQTQLEWRLERLLVFFNGVLQIGSPLVRVVLAFVCAFFYPLGRFFRWLG